jgi:ABC-2 type transport system permease protein
MNLFLIPLWLLSGAVFPAAGAPRFVGWVMNCNPLTYGVSAIRHGLYWQQPLATADWVALGITVVFAVVMFVLSLAATRRTTAGDLQ